jgi:hypothetical protein
VSFPLASLASTAARQSAATRWSADTANASRFYQTDLYYFLMITEDGAWAADALAQLP